MNKNTFDAIKVLSLSDTKSLSQKTLKAMEELGELSKSVLPYDNAFATNHRIVSKEDILENVADTILCLLSIGYDIGASDEELDTMLVSKMQKWSDLQSRDREAKWPVPFEIHITVKEGDLTKFKETCASVGVKPLLLHLQTELDGIIPDLMTSSIIIGRNSDAMDHVEKVKTTLETAGFEVVRSKIEAAPWHPMAPTENNKMPKDCYFECHFAVKIIDRGPLESYVRNINRLKISRNPFKKHEDGQQTVMITYRDYVAGRPLFETTVKTIKDDMIAMGFNVDKTIIEFSVFDTKVSHDKKWIGE